MKGFTFFGLALILILAIFINRTMAQDQETCEVDSKWTDECGNSCFCPDGTPMCTQMDCEPVDPNEPESE